VLAERATVSRAQTFIINSNASILSISGSAIGSAIKEQGAGSLTTKYFGTVNTILGNNTIQFPGLSLVVAHTNGNWTPRSDASVGTEAANYGALVTPLFTTANAALRQVKFDASSTVTNIVSGRFDTHNLVFQFPTDGSSKMAYRVTGLLNTNGVASMSGYATNNHSSMGTLGTTGNVQTLTIPVNATFLLSLLSTNDTTVVVSGNVVATRTVEATLFIQSFIYTNQTVTLLWSNAPNLTYQVQSATDLPHWRTNATGITSSSSSYSWSGPATNTSAVYRLAR
jgi:hypothetical protein